MTEESKRITISIPDELAKRLVAVKDSFNVSGVCQEAIEREVSRQELLLKGDKEMEDVIERLKLEKEKYSEQYKDQGYKDGYEGAKEMSYDELVEVVCGDESLYKTDVWFQWLEDKVEELSKEYAAFDDDAYLEGWQEGVNTFWEEIKGQL